MAVDFLTDEQKAQYGQYPEEPNELQLAKFFHLDDTDRALIDKKRRDHNRLGFAIQLVSVRFLGTFLVDPCNVPPGAISYVARQIEIDNTDCLQSYLTRKQTRYDHVSEIQSIYEYYEFSSENWRFRLTRFLYARAWISNERPSLLFDYATAWLIQHRVLLPGVTTLSRIISEVRERSNRRFWRRLSCSPSLAQKAMLLEILNISESSRTSDLDLFRQGPTRISGPAFNSALERHQKLSRIGIHQLDLKWIPIARLKNLARYAAVTPMHKIARMSEERRIATLVAFVYSYEIIALDDAIDVLDLLISDIARDAKNIGKKNRIRSLKDLDKAAISLAEVCSILLDEEASDADLRAAIFNKIPLHQLKKSVDTVVKLARPPNHNYHEEMVEQYGKVRRFLPKMLHGIKFQAAPAGAPVISALQYLAAMEGKKKQTLNDAPHSVINKSWRRLVYMPDGQISRRGYTLCVLDRLQDCLRRRDIYVEGSDRWGDPRAKLLQGEKWEASRLQICRSLEHPVSPNDALTGLQKKLEACYQRTAINFKNNEAVRIDHSGKYPSVTISNLDKLEEPPSLVQLRRQIISYLPKVELTELLLEINARTGFIDEFTHVSEANARAEDLSVSVCAVLLAEACNIGMEPLIKHNISALTRHRLSWTKQNYIRAETLTPANARLVDYQSSIPLARVWGGGEVASADGMRFVTPTRTINSGPNRKYFGAHRGITWYNFMSDQFAGFHGMVVPGTLRDSLFVLEGLLEQQTGLSPREIMTDTAGASDLIFGLFWLLGYQFSPRLADAGESILWRIDADADYGPLNELARRCIQTDHIVRHWDDMMRITGSLKLGTVQASTLVRSLLKSERPSSLAKAIIEVGRINKTIYLLDYIDDEEYRRRILTQLNRGESRHAVARVICHGQRGEIRKRYREGQEDQLGALGLVTNAVVLWNTIYMEAALEHMKAKAIPFKMNDVARLSPLPYAHLNVLGNYSFTLAEPVLRGELRPLNLPETGPFVP